MLSVDKGLVWLKVTYFWNLQILCTKRLNPIAKFSRLEIKIPLHELKVVMEFGSKSSVKIEN